MDPALHVTQVRAGSRRVVRGRSVQGQGLLWSYRFFGSALVGRAPHQLPLGVRATLTWAAAEARRHVRSGRAAPDQEEVLGLRLAYQALKAEAATVRASREIAKGDVLAAAIALRHRQRAAMLLRHGLALSEGDVARVLGVRPTQAQPVIACAEAAIARRLGGPVDVSRALRRAASVPVADPADAAEQSVARVVRLPRPSPVQVLIAPAPPAAVQTESVARHEDAAPREGGMRPRSVWSLIGRVAAAATVGMLFAWAIWPVH